MALNSRLSLASDEGNFASFGNSCTLAFDLFKEEIHVDQDSCAKDVSENPNL